MTRAERNKDYEINFEYYVTELMKYPAFVNTSYPKFLIWMRLKKP